MEVTKWLKTSRCGWSHIGEGASVRAATRVNAEQASKRTMCRPTRLQFRGRLIRLGEMSEDDAQPLHRGTGGSTHTRKARATRKPPKRGQVRDDRTNRSAREGQAGRCGVAEKVRSVPRKPGNSGGGKGPQFKHRRRTWRSDMEIGQPINST